MRILFCNIAWMKKYQGTTDDDIPINGGAYVKKHKDGNESINFFPFNLIDENGTSMPTLYGSVETKATSKSGAVNQLHIEKINGCGSFKNEDYVDDILVVWCATSSMQNSLVVGWYEHATVFREYREVDFFDENGEKVYTRVFNVMAQQQDSVLLPVRQRVARDGGVNVWQVPRFSTGSATGYGFGQANVWFASEPEASEYVADLVRKIEQYSGPNEMYY